MIMSHNDLHQVTPSHTESHRVGNVTITSHIDTKSHRVTASQKCDDNVHVDSHRVTPSNTESHRVINVMITSHPGSHRVTPSEKCNDNVPH